MGRPRDLYIGKNLKDGVIDDFNSNSKVNRTDAQCLANFI